MFGRGTFGLGRAGPVGSRHRLCRGWLVLVIFGISLLTKELFQHLSDKNPSDAAMKAKLKGVKVNQEQWNKANKGYFVVSPVLVLFAL